MSESESVTPVIEGIFEGGTNVVIVAVIQPRRRDRNTSSM